MTHNASGITLTKIKNYVSTYYNDPNILTRIADAKTLTDIPMWYCINSYVLCATIIESLGLPAQDTINCTNDLQFYIWSVSGPLGLTDAQRLMNDIGIRFSPFIYYGQKNKVFRNLW